jgi:catechol 2,3-dioxygenase-like lactoylglutathione lyase family enzyme
VQPSHVTLVCRDIPAGVAFFRDVLALPVRQRGPHYAEIDLGDRTAGLTPPPEAADTDESDPNRQSVLARIPSQRTRGVILQVRVDDVVAALEEARSRGAIVLMDRVITEWGTESAFVAGPDDVVVEIYRDRF